MMIKLVGAQQMKALDYCAMTTYMMPSTLLMENAAEHIARAALERLPEGGRCTVFAGSGNNGGDGIAAAVLLRAESVDVRVFLTGSYEKMTDDALEMQRRFENSGGTLEDFDASSSEQADFALKSDVIIDAMFGIGLNSPLRGAALEAARLINACGGYTIASDIPSGVEADTGRILGEAVMADATVTFTAAKPGQFTEPGCVYAGEVRVCSIGIPEELERNLSADAYAVQREDISLPKRDRLTHKTNYGRDLIVGGCVGYTGAPVMAADAASRTGAGLVALAVPESIYAMTAIKCLETMPFPVQADEDGVISYEARGDIREFMEDCAACLIGPGMGHTMMTEYLVENIVLNSKIPLILDADGINSIAANINSLDKAKCPVVLTPHEGEFARLGGEVDKYGRLEAARRFAEKHKCVLVLKGHRTVTALPDGAVYINTTGGPAMAKGGSGDVLAGMMTALIGQGFPIKDAVLAAVYLHGLAGDICAMELGEYSVTAGDIIGAIPKAVKATMKSR